MKDKADRSFAMHTTAAILQNTLRKVVLTYYVSELSIEEEEGELALCAVCPHLMFYIDPSSLSCTSRLLCPASPEPTQIQ